MTRAGRRRSWLRRLCVAPVGTLLDTQFSVWGWVDVGLGFQELLLRAQTLRARQRTDKTVASDLMTKGDSWDKLLSPTGWFNSSILDAYCALLQQTTPSVFFHMTIQTNRVSSATFRNQNKLRRAAVVFIDNPTEHHWIVIVVRNRTITCHDFLNRDRNARKIRLDLYMEWWKRHMNGEVLTSNGNECYDIEQNDSYSCGVYACVVCECISRGEWWDARPTHLFSDALMQGVHRRRIASRLLAQR